MFIIQYVTVAKSQLWSSNGDNGGGHHYNSNCIKRVTASGQLEKTKSTSPTAEACLPVWNWTLLWTPIPDFAAQCWQDSSLLHPGWFYFRDFFTLFISSIFIFMSWKGLFIFCNYCFFFLFILGFICFLHSFSISLNLFERFINFPFKGLCHLDIFSFNVFLS